MFIGHLYGYELLAAALRKTEEDGKTTYYRVVYTLKAIHDTFQLSVALGNLGLRLESEEHEYSFKVSTDGVNGQIIPDRMARVISAHLHMDLATGKKFPTVVERNYYDDLGEDNYIASVLLEELFLMEPMTHKYPFSHKYKIRRALYSNKRVLNK